MKRALIILSSIAVVLGVISFFVVFYSGGNYVVSSPLPSDSTYSSSTVANASSTASSTLADASSTANGSSTLAEYSSDYSEPPISWSEGAETISVAGATLSGSQLTLKLTIQMGTMAECVPMNIRLIADEKGDLTAPLTTQFAFPESGTCQGTPGTTYNGQEVVFTVDPATLPLVFTTGGTSSKFFELSTTPQGGITVAPPPTNG